MAKARRRLLAAISLLRAGHQYEVLFELLLLPQHLEVIEVHDLDSSDERVLNIKHD